MSLSMVTDVSICARFEGARSRISQKYDAVERRLIERFVSAQKRDDRDAMKEVAAVVAQFKGFSQCVDAFIEQSQMVSELIPHFH